jgi:hypothetical protein
MSSANHTKGYTFFFTILLYHPLCFLYGKSRAAWRPTYREVDDSFLGVQVRLRKPDRLLALMTDRRSAPGGGCRAKAFPANCRICFAEVHHSLVSRSEIPIPAPLKNF